MSDIIYILLTKMQKFNYSSCWLSMYTDCFRLSVSCSTVYNNVFNVVLLAFSWIMLNTNTFHFLTSCPLKNKRYTTFMSDTIICRNYSWQSQLCANCHNLHVFKRFCMMCLVLRISHNRDLSSLSKAFSQSTKLY